MGSPQLLPSGGRATEAGELARAGSRSIEKSSKRWHWVTVTEGMKAEVERGWLFGSLGGKLAFCLLSPGECYWPGYL